MSGHHTTPQQQQQQQQQQQHQHHQDQRGQKQPSYCCFAHPEGVATISSDHATGAIESKDATEATTTTTTTIPSQHTSIRLHADIWQEIASYLVHASELLALSAVNRAARHGAVRGCRQLLFSQRLRSWQQVRDVIVSRFPFVRSIHFKTTNVRDAFLESLTASDLHLQQLHASRCFALSGASLPALSQAQGLEVVSMSHVQLPDTLAFPHAKGIALTNCTLAAREPGWFWRFLHASPSVEVLCLGAADLSPADVTAVEGQPFSNDRLAAIDVTFVADEVRTALQQALPPHVLLWNWDVSGSDIFAQAMALIRNHKITLSVSDMEKLIACSASCSNPTFKHSALHSAARATDSTALVSLLAVLDREAVNCRDSKGRTPLYHAAYSGVADNIRALVAHGADMQMANYTFERPIDVAALRGHADAVAALVEAEQASESKGRPTLSVLTDSGWSALHLACVGGNAAIVERLLQHGYQLEEPNKFGQTPLFLAVRKGYDDIVHLLCRLGADPASRDALGESCLQAAERAAPHLVSVLHQYLATRPSVSAVPRAAGAPAPRRRYGQGQRHNNGFRRSRGGPRRA